MVFEQRKTVAVNHIVLNLLSDIQKIYVVQFFWYGVWTKKDTSDESY